MAATWAKMHCHPCTATHAGFKAAVEFAMIVIALMPAAYSPGIKPELLLLATRGILTVLAGILIVLAAAVVGVSGRLLLLVLPPLSPLALLALLLLPICKKKPESGRAVTRVVGGNAAVNLSACKYADKPPALAPPTTTSVAASSWWRVISCAIAAFKIIPPLK